MRAIDWSDPKWQNPLVTVATNGSYDGTLPSDKGEGVSDQ